jgi:hypothetical protein
VFSFVICGRQEFVIVYANDDVTYCITDGRPYGVIVTEIFGTWERPHWIVVIVMIVKCAARTREYCNIFCIVECVPWLGCSGHWPVKWCGTCLCL